jgi:hypothetical protein|tara:strand:+ start:26 stop:628 length:603 start_codon:yes stop_codon:yes gene_type:complete
MEGTTMKIAITGTTAGLGEHLANKLIVSHTVLGFSRSNGYNIAKAEDREKIRQEIEDCDVFVNNAWTLEDADAQTHMLSLMLDAWSEKNNKLLVNINSRTIETPEPERLDNVAKMYYNAKLEQSKILHSYVHTDLEILPRYPRVLEILPSYFESRMTTYLNKNVNTMPTANLAEIIATLIVHKDAVHTSRIILSPVPINA